MTQGAEGAEGAGQTSLHARAYALKSFAVALLPLLPLNLPLIVGSGPSQTGGVRWAGARFLRRCLAYRAIEQLLVGVKVIKVACDYCGKDMEGRRVNGHAYSSGQLAGRTRWKGKSVSVRVWTFSDDGEIDICKDCTIDVVKHLIDESVKQKRLTSSS